MNKDKLEKSNAIARKQVCQVKIVRGKNISDKGIPLSSFSAEELTEAQKQDGNLEHLSTWFLGRFLLQRSFLDEILKSTVTTWNETVSG